MRHNESVLQKNCVNWFRLQYQLYARLLFAVPNGGARGKVTAAIMKSEGVVAGVADLILLVPNGKYNGLCIEMKTENGKQSAAQTEWEREVSEMNYLYRVVRSLDEFVELVNNYIGMSRQTDGRI